ncbi:3-oxoacyl-ACP reductase FabG [Chryseobacterium chendengshani]|uniref:3-oxoacyl-ACP reductase family protein n=1 Tax=Chryseobacterium sp. LJ668 TaxID=2864040 RepID=UPI001C69331C|nr:3-oxoacyl-ACP reductase family protein [Chryseobacterium sp. LJ668]MBW8523503.1 3-oxoacyl-ACP reductase FabG [Chryseobacterium sp. LJ668]QYK15788.1 3-oxoacyl-ACP reductase FabG [Chryseobacterium sp. LJ668]
MQNLKNKVAFVTGGSRGIGQEIVRKFVSEGVNVAFTYASSEETANLLASELSNEEIKVLPIKADSSNAESILNAVEQAHRELGNFDILVNNAGLGGGATLYEVSLDDFDRLVAVNIRGVFVVTQAVAALMNDEGRIITIGSTAAERAMFPGTAVYGMTKAAVAGFTRGVARDLAARKITVNTVQPGPIDTEMNPADSQFADFLRSFIALGSYGTKSDVAELAAFLASPQAKFITGTSINVDGGLVS